MLWNMKGATIAIVTIVATEELEQIIKHYAMDDDNFYRKMSVKSGIQLPTQMNA